MEFRKRWLENEDQFESTRDLIAEAVRRRDASRVAFEGTRPCLDESASPQLEIIRATSPLVGEPTELPLLGRRVSLARGPFTRQVLREPKRGIEKESRNRTNR